MNHPPDEKPAIRAFRKGLARFDATEQLPPLLYHYTTSEGFLGIAKSGWLRGTSVRYMNDPAEWVYGQRMVLHCREELKGETRTGSLARRWLDEAVFPEIGDGIDAYLVAFSEDRDSLPQWRAYGDDGAGVVLGIDWRLVRQSVWFVRVEYEPVAQERGVLERLRAITTFLGDQEAAGTSSSDAEELLAAALEVGPSWIAPYQVSLKPPAWKYEQEWRAVRLSTDYYGDRRPALRVRNGRFVPYIGSLVPVMGFTNVTDSPLREVVLGPLRDYRNDPKVLQDFLEPHIAIHCSDIGYRR